MSIQHKFLNRDWGNGFQTHNAILDNTPYLPEILILGTYNPNSLNNNFADFFYGRNWLWTGFKNLFVHNEIIITNKRINTNPTNPDLQEIFELCKRLKLAFADLITETLHNENPNYEEIPINKVNLNNQIYSLIDDNGLNQLNLINQVNWNTQNIIDYLIKTPSIKKVYFTRKPTGIWLSKWNQLRNNPLLNNVDFINIHTPSGMGLQERGIPIMNALLRRWIINANPNFGVLDNEWLIKNGVNLNNFTY